MHEELPEWAASIHHDGSPRYCSSQLPGLNDPVRLWLRIGRNVPLRRALLRTAPDGEQEFSELRLVAENAVCGWWQGELAMRAYRMRYRFLLVTEQGNWHLNAAGLTRHTPPDAGDFTLLAEQQAPGWIDAQIFYQIFPDRFADGDPRNNVQNGAYRCHGVPVVARPWGALPQRHQGSGAVEFFGGDLAGIEQRLDYLQDLGISALYLNPIFTAPSNHKYDVVDYRQVDPQLGGNPALASLRRALDERGMRLMLDVVPNHCSSTHPWFLAAQADPAAPTAEYFTFYKHPDQYECWMGVQSMPKLNYRSERLCREMFAEPESIMRQWLRPPYRIDGWRIDVANMLARQGESQLGHVIGRALRRAIKAENPRAYLLGENFFDGSAHLQGDELDAVMNYRGFALPLLNWLAGFDLPAFGGRPWGDPVALPTSALVAQWRSFLAAIPWQIAIQQFNLLGSHDTPRLMTALGGRRELVEVAVTLLFTFPGVPSIFYGDEIGLRGGGDPDMRRCMPWNEAEWDHHLREHYRRLAWLRRNRAALWRGGFQIVYADGETLAYLREDPEGNMLVLARRSYDSRELLPLRHAGIADGSRLREFFSGAQAGVENGTLRLSSLGAPGAQIWEIQGG
jgi:alpha-glucosidase